MQVSAVIPARLESTRLPRKVLAAINGRPLLQHVWEAAAACAGLDELFVATDSPEIQRVARDFGASVIMTPRCGSGTERIASVLNSLTGDLIINIQADEISVDSEVLNSLIDEWSCGTFDVITPVYRIQDLRKLTDPNVVKVIRSDDGETLDFTRLLSLPDTQAAAGATAVVETAWGHMGIYGYRREVLAHYDTFPDPENQVDDLEQLCFLRAGYRIQTVEVSGPRLAINTPRDLQRARA